MEYIKRQQERAIRAALARNKSVLLLGPRQTGKTTVVCRQAHQLHLNLMRPDLRQRYEKSPGVLAGEVEALQADNRGARPTVILDEVQKVPGILDVVQDLIDRKVANFILTGSSARKLRRHGHANLLPGRVVALRLDPLSLEEYSPTRLEEALLDGALPGIVSVREVADREQDLTSYVTAYLEEEVRAEAIVRNLGPFARFLEYAAAESGRLINAHKLSQGIGVSHTTIGSYFQILEDCLIIERVEPITQSRTRRKLARSQKFLFFDMGVRRVAAHEGRRLPAEVMGLLFEQFVGLELIRQSRSSGRSRRIRFWRDPDGPEVDWVVETEDRLTPIEVKWTEIPSERDARHIRTFQDEYTGAGNGFVVCRAPRRMRLADRVTALPWQELQAVL